MNIITSSKWTIRCDKTLPRKHQWGSEILSITGLLSMQRDESKLILARRLRHFSRFFLLLSPLIMANWLIFFVSDGFRDPLHLGHDSVILATVTLFIFFVLSRKAYRLEFPFLSSKR